jgi:hypothetical protein
MVIHEYHLAVLHVRGDESFEPFDFPPHQIVLALVAGLMQSVGTHTDVALIERREELQLKIAKLFTDIPQHVAIEGATDDGKNCQ